MSDRKPLVLGDDGRPQQVQGGDHVDPSTLPDDEGWKKTRRLVLALARVLIEHGFELPEEILKELE